MLEGTLCLCTRAAPASLPDSRAENGIESAKHPGFVPRQQKPPVSEPGINLSKCRMPESNLASLDVFLHLLSNTLFLASHCSDPTTPCPAAAAPALKSPPIDANCGEDHISVILQIASLGNDGKPTPALMDHCGMLSLTRRPFRKQKGIYNGSQRSLKESISTTSNVHGFPLQDGGPTDSIRKLHLCLRGLVMLCGASIHRLTRSKGCTSL